MIISDSGARSAAVAQCFLRGCAGLDQALRGGDLPVAPPSDGTSGRRGKQAASSASWHIPAAEQPPEPAASSCSLEQL